MKRILFFFLLTALPFLAAAQTVKDSVTVLTDAQISFGSWSDSVRMYFIQGGTWKKQRMDTLAQYVATKIGGVTTFSAGTTGFTPSTATSGAVTLAGTLSIANGGTNATTASQARTNLGLAIGTDVLAPNGSAANLTSFPTLNQNTTGSAASLTTARDIQVNLASTTAASFNGTANIQPGVTGTLPIGNGGTGQTSYTDGQLLIGNTATGGLSKATLTAGSNVTITNGNGTITIAATGGGGGGSGVISGVVAGEVGYGIGADSIGGTGNLFWSAANNRLRVSSDAADTNPVGTVMVKSSGTGTGAALAIENSAGTDRFTILDNGEIDLYNTAVTNNQTNGTAYINNATTNGSIVIAPNGTGALLADLPDNTAAGGNARGTNAVDLQSTRAINTQVASGTESVVGGGRRNTASGTGSVVVGGLVNTASSTEAFVGSGNSNTAGTNSRAVIVGGQDNTATGLQSFIGSGQNNTASGNNSAVLGSSNTASAANSTALGGSANAYITNMLAIGSGGSLGGGSNNQTSSIRMYKDITGTAQTSINSNGGSENSLLSIASPNGTNGRLWNATIQVVAIVQTQGNGTADSIAVGKSFIGNYAVGIKRIGTNTSLVGTVQNLHNVQADAGMGSSIVTIDADDTNEALRIRFTPPSGAGSTTVIRVVATVYLTEVGY